MQKNDMRSLLMLVLSMIIYGSIGIFRRNIPLPSAVLACYRGIFGALLLLLFAILQKRKPVHPIGKKKVLGLILSGAVMGLNWILLFEAYNYTSVATATLCYYMEPAIFILSSPLVFQEKITMKKLICVLLSVTGMFFISGIIENGMPQISEIKGILFGIAAAVLYAIVVILNRKMPGIDAYEKTIIQLFSAGIVLLPWLLIDPPLIRIDWTPAVIILLFIIGFVHTGLAYALYFGSIDKLKTQTVAIFSYLDPITALILSALILREKMSVYDIIGAVLIIGAALISEISLKNDDLPETAGKEI